MSKLEEYKTRSLIGLNYLIKYYVTRDKINLEYVKENIPAIKIWALVTFLQSNLELLGDNLPKNVIDSLFDMEPLTRAKSNLMIDNGKDFDYGIGYQSNSKSDRRKQIWYLRNALSHNDFDITEDGYIKIEDDYYSSLSDPKWLEAVLLSAIASRRNGFYKGLNDFILYSPYSSEKNYTKEDILNLIKNNTFGAIKVTLNTNDRQKLLNVLNYDIDEEYTFNDTFISIQDVLAEELKERLPQDESLKKLKMLIKVFNESLKGAIVLKYEPLDYKLSKEIIDHPEFNKDSFYDNINIIFNHIQMSTKEEIYNLVSYKYLLEILNAIDTNLELQPKEEIYLDESFGFIIRTFGNIIFSAVVSTQDNFLTNSKKIERRYYNKLNMSYGYAKSYYKEVINKYRNALEDMKTKGETSGFRQGKVEKLLNQFEYKLNALEKDKNPDSLFKEFRDIFVHGYSHVKDDKVILYDKDIPRKYPKYSLGKKSWVIKDIKESPETLRVEISLNDFLSLTNDVCHLYNVDLKQEKTKKISL